MRRVNMETAVGLFLLAGILCLAYLSVRLGKLELIGGDTVPVTAGFSSVTGLRTGTDVEIAGVPVGKVDSISIREHQAIVMMQITQGDRASGRHDRVGEDPGAHRRRVHQPFPGGVGPDDPSGGQDPGDRGGGGPGGADRPVHPRERERING